MIARRCRALGEPARLRILFLLQEHALSVGEFARAVETSTANASRHVWDRRMVERMGAAIRPLLELLRVACLRILRGESLDGLLLPAELLTPGAFSDYAAKAGAPLPEQ